MAINNIYILVDKCDNNCAQCSSTYCSLCEYPY